jgi:membrane-bound acyltransferase YfiQ involved in biofilm formation
MSLSYLLKKYEWVWLGICIAAYIFFVFGTQWSTISITDTLKEY